MIALSSSHEAQNWPSQIIILSGLIPGIRCPMKNICTISLSLSLSLIYRIAFAKYICTTLFIAWPQSMLDATGTSTYSWYRYTSKYLMIIPKSSCIAVRSIHERISCASAYISILFTIQVQYIWDIPRQIDQAETLNIYFVFFFHSNVLWMATKK